MPIIRVATGLVDLVKNEPCSLKPASTIDRPIVEVFDYTLNNVAEWSLTVIEDEVIEETPDHVGCGTLPQILRNASEISSRF